MNEQPYYGNVSGKNKIISSLKHLPLANEEIKDVPQISFKSLTFDYFPYPIGFLSNVISRNFYNELAKSFPSIDDLKSFSDMGQKYLLSENSDNKKFYQFLSLSEPWAKFYKIIKSVNFVRYILTILRHNNIDLGISHFPILFDNNLGEIPHLTTRFEFSILLNGGYHLPHTDIPKKLVSIVISFSDKSEWINENKGGTSTCLPIKKSLIFNQVNKYRSFEDVKIIKRYPFIENSGILLIKTYNSWHCVEPIQVSDSQIRKSIVIQLIRNDLF